MPPKRKNGQQSKGKKSPAQKMREHRLRQRLREAAEAAKRAADTARNTATQSARRSSMSDEQKEQERANDAARKSAHRVSFSEEQKEEVRANDAARKSADRENMSDEQKEEERARSAARMSARRENMSDEQKEQEKENNNNSHKKRRTGSSNEKLASALNTDWKALTVCEYLENCEGFSKRLVGNEPYCTVLDHYEKSGVYDFHALHQLENLKEGTIEYQQVIQKVTAELEAAVPTIQEQIEMQKDYLGGVKLPVPGESDYGNIYVCACCGVKILKKYHCMSLGDLRHLCVPANNVYLQRIEDTIQVPLDSDGSALGTVALKDVLGWHYSSSYSSFMYLHRDFVDTDDNGTESCIVCDPCHRKLSKGKKPTYLPMAVTNFGNLRCIRHADGRLCSMAPLNELESMLVSPARRFQVVLKISEVFIGNKTEGTKSQLRGSFILFPHDALYVAMSDLLNRKTWDRVLQIQFLCHRGRADRLMQMTRKTTLVSGRAHLLIQYLSVWKLMFGTGIFDDALPIVTDLRDNLKEFCAEAIRTAVVLNNDKLADMQVNMRSDVANIRSESTLFGSAVDGGGDSCEHVSDVSGADLDDVQEEVTTSVTLVTQSGYMASSTEGLSTTDRSLQEVNCPEVSMIADIVNFVEAACDAPGGEDTNQVDDDDDGERNGGDDAGGDDDDDDDGDQSGTAKRSGVVDDYLSSLRGEKPLNEFEHGRLLEIMAFPDLFLLGRPSYCHRKPRMLTQVDLRHMLLQYDCRAARNLSFHAYEYDKRSRHRNLSAVSGVMTTHLPYLSHFLVWFQGSPDGKQMLANCKADPTCDDAKKLLKQFRVVLKAIRSKRGGRNDIVSVGYAGGCRYGSSPEFLTGCPSDINSPTAFRLALPCRSNRHFPAVAGADFLQAMLNEGSVEGVDGEEIMCDARNMRNVIANNPVASALNYELVVQNLFAFLIGRPLYSQGGRQKAISRKGCAGHYRSAIGVTESTKRDVNHCHLIKYGGIQPWVISKVAHHPELREKLLGTLEKLYQTHFPREFHVLALTERYIREHIVTGIQAIGFRRRDGIYPVPDIRSDEYRKHVNQVACNCNLHNHSFTCTTGPLGLTGCRMTYPKENCENSAIYQLEKGDGGKDAVPVPVEGGPKQLSFQPSSDYPLPPPDPRALVTELKRPLLEPLPSITSSSEDDRRDQQLKALVDAMKGADPSTCLLDFLGRMPADLMDKLYAHVSKELPTSNGNVVTFNPLCTALLASNTAKYNLGNSSESNSSLFYICPYLNKGEPKISEVMSLFCSVSDKIDKVDTVAPDGNTPVGKLRRALGRTMNKAATMEEKQDVSTATNLIGFPELLTTDSYVFYDAATFPRFAQYVRVHGIQPLCSIGLRGKESICLADYESEDDADLEDGRREEYESCSENSTSYDEGDDSSTCSSESSCLSVGNEKESCAVGEGMTSSASCFMDVLEYVKKNFAPPDSSSGVDVTAEKCPVDSSSTAIPTGAGVDRSSDYDAECAIPQYDFEVEPFKQSEKDQVDGMGLIKMYEFEDPVTGDKRKVYVHTHLGFFMRGEALRHLCPYEYASVIEMRDIPKKRRSNVPVENGNNVTTTAGSSSSYAYPSQFPVSQVKEMWLRRTSMTVRLIGSLPKWPGPRPDEYKKQVRWDARRDRYGAFYVGLFGDYSQCYGMGHLEDGNSYSWEGFEKMVTNYRCEGTAIAFGRLRILENHVNCMRVLPETKVLVNKWRARKRRMWTSDERAHLKSRKRLRLSIDKDFNDKCDSFESRLRKLERVNKSLLCSVLRFKILSTKWTLSLSHVRCLLILAEMCLVVLGCATMMMMHMNCIGG